MTRQIPLILTGVLLNAFAQLFLKNGMRSVGQFSLSLENLIPVLVSVGSTVYIWLGFLCYAVSIGLWLLVLSRVDVSFAYPFLSIGYIVTALIGYTVFGESLSTYRIAGIFVICVGVILISKS